MNKLFYVEGRGKKSGRKKKPRTILATSERAARADARRMDIEPEVVRLVDVTHFSTHVAGTSHDNHANRGGGNRQQIVKKCLLYESLYLCRETGHPRDKHAIMILKKSGEQVGYVAANVAEILCDHFLAEPGSLFASVALGCVPFSEINEDRRPTPNSPLTLSIVVVAALPESSQSNVAGYARQVVPEAAVGQLAFGPMPSAPYQPMKPRSRKADDVSGDKSGSCLGSILIGATALLGLGLVALLADSL